ncbi:MAG: amidinotransferase [Chitinophagales bacterium]|nr:amidinotransferase [Chitinophagales bacterium]
MQCASNILMVRPASFQYNEETAKTNDYQNKPALSKAETIAKAQEEFDKMVDILEENNINVWVVEDDETPEKPDAIFPNNWISMHQNGDIYLYPMLTKNRRVERDPEIIEFIKENFAVNSVNDWSHYENEGLILEGTGSMIFDHLHSKVYACISPRTNEKLLKKFAKEIEYDLIQFHAYKTNGEEQYHTNVVMCIGYEFAVICLDSITNKAERTEVKASLEEDGLEIIEITREQLEQHFAGNMLQVYNDDKQLFLIMSQRAYDSLTEKQLSQIEAHTEIITVPINFIEEVGGGSARCMMAEIFLPEL